MDTSASCHDEQRRQAVRAHVDRETGQPDLNGIDYIEVSDDQRVLTLHFLRKAPPQLGPANVRIDGGRRIIGITVERVWLCSNDDPELDDCLKLRVSRPGDFSTYTLRLVEPDARGRPGGEPLTGFDRRYAEIAFSFKANCPTELDCRADDSCPPETLPEPEISYLAKDYASFRQLILDRLALTMPEWRERHAPDLGIALVEVLAYVGDHLSYYQDAVATEAYLDTARQRISVRRHARLVDYQMHDGCNARAWLCLETDDDLTLDPREIFFITGSNDALPLSSGVLLAEQLQELPRMEYEVFEPIQDSRIALHQAHNRISFYTWLDRECCLTRGSTSATLRDEWADLPIETSIVGLTARSDVPPGQVQRRPPAPPADPAATRERRLQLHIGDVLILEEVLGPRTGVPADADLGHRHAVRLTRVERTIDRLYEDEQHPDGLPVVEIEWAVEDALPFALCIAAIGRAPECRYLEDISVARGNVILVDHGLSDGRTTDEPLPVVPALELLDAGCAAAAEPNDPQPRAARYRPTLRYGPLTQRELFPAPAAIAGQQALRVTQILPQVQRRIHQLWQQVQAGQTLRATELDELRTIFGARAVTQSGLEGQPGPRPRDRRPPSAQQQAAALSWLLARQDQLLRRKVRRMALLAERARSGYVLDAGLIDEIGALFGPAYSVNLGASDPALFGPASGALQQSPRAALPVLRVREQPADETFEERRWEPRRDLLDSGPGDRHLVAEVDDAGQAHLRFGDDNLGRSPTPGTTLLASYRTGNGAAGNVGAEAISRLVLRQGALSGVTIRPRNPLPATGGIDPEPVAEVKLFAPTAFRSELQRAVTADDYARLAERHPRVQRAAATLRWNGSWYAVEVAIDPLAGDSAAPADDTLLAEIEAMLYPYRRIGHDLVVSPARYVPLAIELAVCVQPSYLRGHVQAALLDALGNRALPGGGQGFFHPDRLSFGTPIYLSQLIATARAIPGVETVAVTRLDRLGEGASDALATGKLALSPLEVAQLDNDPNAPDRGTLRLTLRGGR